MTTYAILGAGMAGLACAHRLLSAGHSVAMFDKGRGVGGRMATRRVETPCGRAQFDYGEQYFTARDSVFAAALEAYFDSAREPLVAQAHRWRCAQMERPADTRFAWKKDLHLGLCSDWRIGPHVEAAWLSGHHLASATLA